MDAVVVVLVIGLLVKYSDVAFKKIQWWYLVLAGDCVIYRTKRKQHHDSGSEWIGFVYHQYKTIEYPGRIIMAIYHTTQHVKKIKKLSKRRRTPM